MENKDKKMNIKIPKSGVNKDADTKGSSRSLAEYLNHEDAERLADGKELIPFRTPEGETASTEEVIQAIDGNTKGLSKKEDKFFHLVVSPSKEELAAMGGDEKTVYTNSISLMRAIISAYADGFNRDGVNDESDILAYWKAHTTRGDDDEEQYHIHVIISRNSKVGMGGKTRKISPLTNHVDTQQGRVKGGFSRKLFFRKCEAIFDRLFHYERSVAESFDYRNAMAHGTPEERAEQTQRLAEEKAEGIKAAIAAGIERRRKNLATKSDIKEIAALLEGEKSIVISQKEKKAIPDALNQADMKNDISRAFEATDKAADLFIELACMGITCRKRTSADGVESLDFYMGGVQYSSLVIFTETKHRSLLERFCAITHLTPAFRTREIQAELKAKKEQETAQHKIGGCKLRRH